MKSTNYYISDIPRDFGSSNKSSLLKSIKEDKPARINWQEVNKKYTKDVFPKETWHLDGSIDFTHDEIFK